MLCWAGLGWAVLTVHLGYAVRGGRANFLFPLRGRSKNIFGSFEKQEETCLRRRPPQADAPQPKAAALWIFIRNPGERCLNHIKAHRAPRKALYRLSAATAQPVPRTSRVPAGPKTARQPQHFLFQGAFSETERRQDGPRPRALSSAKPRAGRNFPKGFFKR